MNFKPMLSAEDTPEAEQVPAALKERCAEILHWKKTGLLKGEALRNFADRRFPGEVFSIQMAEAETANEAFRYIAAAPEAPVHAVVPAPWREFVAEVVASAESYERRTGQAVNAEWVKRGKELLAGAPEAPAHKKDNHAHETKATKGSMGNERSPVQQPPQAQAVQKPDAVAAHTKADQHGSATGGEDALVGNAARPEPAILSAAPEAPAQADRQRVPKCKCGQPWVLNTVHREHSPCWRAPDPVDGLVAPEAPAQTSAVDERAAFEGTWHLDLSKDKDGFYADKETDLMWMAWQARAALAQKGY